MAHRILVIEDDAGIRSNVIELLTAEGFDPVGADDGESGVQAALAHPPDLIVCDVGMPKLDGHAVLRAVRATPHLGGVPFIFLSARADRSDVREGMRLGADDYLTKPFTNAELLEVVHARLSRHEAAERQFKVITGGKTLRAANDKSELVVSGDEPGAPARYLIEALIGEGGMGAVYRAVDRKLDRKVAIKVLHAELAASEVGRARLLREARAAAKLEHPNAVAIYDVGETADGPFLAMELVEGRPLRTYVGDESVPMPRRVRWLIEVARALSAAHARGLVHRDVKPENVMVRDDGVAKVLDFGIARPSAGLVLADGGVASSGGGTIEGTPYYMAPEQLQGQTVDARADQFGWAVVAFELLSGQLPWDAKGSIMAQIAAMLGKPARTLASAEAAVPPAVSAVVARALSRAPTDRFASMELVVDAIAPFAEAADLSLALRETQPLRLPDEILRSSPKLPVALAAPVAAPVVASDARLGDTVTSRRDPPVVPDRPTSSPTVPRGGPSPIVVAISLVLLAALAYVIVRFA